MTLSLHECDISLNINKIVDKFQENLTSLLSQDRIPHQSIALYTSMISEQKPNPCDSIFCMFATVNVHDNLTGLITTSGIGAENRDMPLVIRWTQHHKGEPNHDYKCTTWESAT